MATESKLNQWLERKFSEVELGPEMLSLIIQVDIKKMPEVKSALRKITDVTVRTQAFDYINISAPVEAIPNIEKLEGVVKIHYDMPTKVLSLPLLAPLNDPIMGKMSTDPIIIPAITLDMLLPLNPMKMIELPNYKYIPVSVTKQALLDVEGHGLTGKGVKVAVLDTGIFNPHPQILFKAREFGTTMFPVPIDDNGHGTWCCSTVVGEAWAAPFGVTDGIAPSAELLAIKVLGYAIGAGSQMSVLEGMEKAYLNGAKIISMSLGVEECQGGCAEEDGGPCPQCRTIKLLSDIGLIFVVAAGNSGPDDNTINCPACSPSSIAVASWSQSDDAISYFSSRGPQNVANATMPITDLTMKPDVASFGGGRSKEETLPNEILYNGCFALLDGMNSGFKHMAEGLQGTSMAAPHFAGLLALAVEKGIVKNTKDVKTILAAKGNAKTKEDGWGLIKLSTFVS